MSERMSDEQIDAIVRDTLRPMIGPDVDAPGWVETTDRALVRAGIAAERERAARCCDAIAARPIHTLASENADHYLGVRDGATICARRIRAGGEAS